MKEYLSSLEPEEYNKVYVQAVMGHMVGQFTLDGDILLTSNPEKYPPKPIEEPVVKPKRHPLQGEFLLPQPFTATGFKVFMVPMTSNYDKAYNQAQSIRGGTSRGRRT